MIAQRMTTGNPAFDYYETQMKSIRARFARESALVTQALDPEIDPALLELFLIYYHGLGVKMTEPVEVWMRRGGERCQELGYEEIGRGLRLHAQQESGHHLLMLADVRALVSRWNARRPMWLDAEAIVAMKPPQGRLRTGQFPAEIAESDQPFRLIAIDYEVERLAVDYGPRMMAHFKRILGDDIEPCLSFLSEHIVIDAGHTRHNQQQLGKILSLRPELVEQMIEDGAAALRNYDSFFGDCLRLARTHLADAPTA